MQTTAADCWTAIELGCCRGKLCGVIRAADPAARIVLDIIGSLDTFDQFREEQLRPSQLDFSGDASSLPVVDALHAALFGIAEKPGNFRRAAKGLDELPIRMWGDVVRVHVPIKHHV